MKIRLIDGHIHTVSRAEITNGRFEIDFKDMTSEEIQEIFSESANLTNIELLTDEYEKYGDIPGYTVYSGVMLVGDTKTVILAQQTDPIQERLTNAETKALEAKTIAEDLKKNGIPAIRDKVLNASVMISRINAQNLSDKEAIEAKDIYETWEELVNKCFISGNAGYKFIYEGNLYKTVNENQRFQIEWIPGKGTESIFMRIDEMHAGTLNDPIPSSKNMEYIKGLYYSDNGNIYIMNRVGMENGEGIILQFLPSELIDQYFEIVDIGNMI